MLIPTKLSLFLVASNNIDLLKRKEENEKIWEDIKIDRYFDTGTGYITLFSFPWFSLNSNWEFLLLCVEDEAMQDVWKELSPKKNLSCWD